MTSGSGTGKWHANPENVREVIAEAAAAGGGIVVLAPGEYRDGIDLTGARGICVTSDPDYPGGTSIRTGPYIHEGIAVYSDHPDYRQEWEAT